MWQQSAGVAVGDRRAPSSLRIVQTRRSRPPWAEGIHPASVEVVATDLDGTLLSPDGTVSSRAAEAVAAARQAGIHVVPVTGRPPQSLWDLAVDAGLGPFGVCSNGAVVVDLEHARVVEMDHLPGELAARLVTKSRRAEPGICFAADNLDAFTHESSFFDAEVDWDEVIHQTDDLVAVLAPGCLKLIARRPGLSSLELIDRLRPVLGPEAHITTSGLDWVDIGVVGITKATALARVCTRLGVEPAGVVAAGDNHNDLPMLEWAGRGLAMANAAEEVLVRADGVLPGNHDDGVALLLEWLVAAGSRHGS